MRGPLVPGLRGPLVVVVTVTLVACASGPPAQPQPAADQASRSASLLASPEPSPAPLASPESSPAPAVDPVLFAVGDIASCDTRTDEQVAALLHDTRGPIALLGDIVYDDGTPAEYAECFDPAWHDLRRRLRPAVGNHEYHTAGASGYFDYFGARAGERGRGWYAYDLGRHWRAVVLNSNCPEAGGCGARSPQGRWLARVLANTPRRHLLAYWHAPRFSTGPHGSTATVAPFWRALHRAGAAIVLNGHDHMYERFAPQTPAGERSATGVRQFTVGTGGRALYEFSRAPLPATQVRDNTTYGVLRLRLEPDGYRWRFLPAAGAFTDRGSRRLPPR